MSGKGGGVSCPEERAKEGRGGASERRLRSLRRGWVVNVLASPSASVEEESLVNTMNSHFRVLRGRWFEYTLCERVRVVVSVFVPVLDSSPPGCRANCVTGRVGVLQERDLRRGLSVTFLVHHRHHVQSPLNL